MKRATKDALGFLLGRNTMSSNELAFYHFEITLIVMLATATRNWADMNERLASRRFQRKWDHLQVLVFVAGW